MPICERSNFYLLEVLSGELICTPACKCCRRNILLRMNKGGARGAGIEVCLFVKGERIGTERATGMAIR